MHQQRVVITGLGILAPNGCGKNTFWQACLQGRSGVHPITHFATNKLPTRIAGQILDFTPQTYGLTPTECTHLDRSTQLAVAASNLALTDARLNPTDWPEADRERTGVYIGTAMASVQEGERLWTQLTEHGT